MKKIYLLLMGLAASLWIHAITFSDGTLKYSTMTPTSHQVSVIGFDDNLSAYSQRYTYIDSVVIYNGVRYDVVTIAAYAFQNNTNIIEIHPHGSQFIGIGAHAFQGCTNLQSTNLFSNGLYAMYIDDYAFEGCTSLTAVGLPNVLSSLGQYAYANCTNLESIYIRETYQMYANSFEGCPIKRVSWDNPYTGMTVTGAPDGQSPLYYLRPTVKRVDIYNSTPARIFYQFPYLEKVSVFGDIVENIGNESFFNCPNLHYVSILDCDNLRSIGDWAFGSCPIDTLYWGIHAKLYNIGTGAFYGFQEDKLTIDCGSSTNKASIGANAFGGNTHLDQLKLYGHYSSIDKDAFRGSTCNYLRINPSSFPTSDYASAAASPFTQLSGLTKVDYMVGAVASPRVPAHAFDGVSTLQEVWLSSKVTDIGKYAFRGTALTSVSLPDTLRSIGEYAFSGTQITTVTIPANVTTLGNRVFGTSLTSLTYKAVNASFSGTGTNSIFNCGNITIGDSVQTIPAFFNNVCTTLTAITIPASVQNIGDKAFYLNSNLTEVALPTNISTLGDNCFGSNSHLKKLTIPGNVPTPGTSFSGTTLNGIYCTCNNVSSVLSKWSSVCSNIVGQGVSDFEMPALAENMMVGRGTVTITKTYPNDDCSPLYTYTATAASGYSFVRWSDGVYNSVRRINVITDAFTSPLYAIFVSPYEYTQLHVNVQPAGGATIRFSDNEDRTHAGGKYLIEYGETTAIITPDIDDDFTFNHWSYDMTYEGSVTEDEDTHVLTVELIQMDFTDGSGKDNQFPIDYTLYLDEKVRITTLVNDENMGRAGYQDNEDGTFTIWASAKNGYEFKGWDVNNDGQIDSTSSMCTVAPTVSTTYTAYFGEIVRTYYVHVITRGSGTAEVVRQESDELYNIPAGETVTLHVQLGENTVLHGWYTPYEETPVTTSTSLVIENIDRDYTFILEIEWIDPSVDGWMAMVQVEPAGEEAGTILSNAALFAEGDNYQGVLPSNFDWELTAEPNTGYRFELWQYMMKDEAGAEPLESTENPLIIAIPQRSSEEMPMVTVFAYFSLLSEGVEQVEGQQSDGKSKKLLRNGVLYILSNGRLYNAQGQLVR